MTDDVWTVVPEPALLDGNEVFTGTGLRVVDFWRFAMPDLKMNSTRGFLAEFLVARAIGATHRRVEWDAFDVLAPDGTRVEVKTSAYVQSWAQRRPSDIVFTGLRGRTWTPESGSALERTFNADVYVFCVHTATTHESYDQLDTSQWDFYVVAADRIAARDAGSIRLSVLQGMTSRVSYAELSATITRVSANPH